MKKKHIIVGYLLSMLCAVSVAGLHVSTVHAYNTAESKALIAAASDYYPVIPATDNQGNAIEVPGSKKTEEFTVGRVVGWVMNIIYSAIAIVAFGFLIWYGIIMIISRGNADDFKKAFAGIGNIAVGLVLMGLSYAIIRFILSVFLKS